MTVWMWVLTGLGAWLGISVLVCLAIAAVLRRLGSAGSELLDPEQWLPAGSREHEEREVTPTAPRRLARAMPRRVRRLRSSLHVHGR